MDFLNTILDIVFPVNCISCKEKGSELCIKCITSLREAERECADWIFPLFDYRDPVVKKAIWFLKYKGKKRLAKILGEILYPRILEELSDLSQLKNFREPILIPIPLSKSRQRERGFNQAMLICENLIKLDKDNYPSSKNKNFDLEKNVLIKIKNGEHQARIEDRGKRLKNIIGSFAVKNKNLIYKRNIILIDDVTTTGATLEEAKRVLKQAGAKKIVAFTIAH